MLHPPLRRSAPRRAFTLIELLIVLLIIGILAAILFPVFGRVRESARTKVCASNMAQLGKAFSLYVQDNGRRYPGAGNYQQWAGGAGGSGFSTPLASNAGHWVTGGMNGTPKNFGATGPGLAANGSPFDYTEGATAMPDKAGLYQYVKDTSIYVCPSTEDSKKKGLGYSMNCALAGIGEVRITQDTQIVLLVDEGKSLNDGYFWAKSDDGATDLLTQVHNGGGNLLFCDGHVRFFPFKTFPLDNTPTGLANKSAMTGNPRFHDRSFGSVKGSAFPSPFTSSVNDTCGETGVAPAVTPAPKP